MHTLKRIRGKYYADGKEFASFREALASIWPR